MKQLSCAVALFTLAVLAAPATATTLRIITSCPPDAVLAGQTCVDKYEASVWQVPVTSRSLIAAIQKGTATLAGLTAGGAVQLGCTSAPFSLTAYADAGFPANGDWTPIFGAHPATPGVYAVSVPGVLPSTCITWFQAEQACALSNKRLLNNQEWQRAAAGTPDPGTDNGTTDCNVGTAGNPVNTGSRANCRSHWGAFDMGGNVMEWVGNWNDLAPDCSTSSTNWPATFGSDFSCIGGDGSLGFLPGALSRGGGWYHGSGAGVFTVRADVDPSSSRVHFGFRCGR